MRPLLSRLDLHILVNLVIGMILGGMIVWGMCQHDLRHLQAQVDQTTAQVQVLQFEVKALETPRIGLP